MRYEGRTDYCYDASGRTVFVESADIEREWPIYEHHKVLSAKNRAQRFRELRGEESDGFCDWQQSGKVHDWGCTWNLGLHVVLVRGEQNTNYLWDSQNRGARAAERVWILWTQKPTACRQWIERKSWFVVSSIFVFCRCVLEEWSCICVLWFDTIQSVEQI